MNFFSTRKSSRALSVKKPSSRMNSSGRSFITRNRLTRSPSKSLYTSKGSGGLPSRTDPLPPNTSTKRGQETGRRDRMMPRMGPLLPTHDTGLRHGFRCSMEIASLSRRQLFPNKSRRPPFLIWKRLTPVCFILYREELLTILVLSRAVSPLLRKLARILRQYFGFFQRWHYWLPEGYF